MSGSQLCVSALCCVLTVLLTAAGHYIASKRSDQAVPLSPFKVTTVSQELTGNGYTVRLQLIGSREPEVYLLRNFQSSPEQLPVGAEGDVEFYTEGSSPYIVFLHPGGYHFLELHLSNASRAAAMVPDIQLLMQGGSEVTFDKGNDADANITFRVDNSLESHIFWDQAFLMKNKTKDDVVDRLESESQSPVRLLEEGRSENERFLHLLVDTSSGDVEGSLQIFAYASFQCREESVCLIQGYAIHQHIPVYQNDHAGPFPEHFIGFEQSPGQEMDHEYCSIHSPFPCTIHCVVIGDQPSPVNIVRVDHGDSQLTPIARVSVANDGFWALGQLIFGNVSVVGRAEYQCSSQSGPEMISRTIKLMIIHEASITQSPVNSLDDGTVEASCLAEGTPAPNVTFYFRNDTAMNDVNSDLFEVVVAPSNGSTSQAVLRMRDQAVADDIRDVRCEAVNVIDGREFKDVRRMHVAEEDPNSTYPPRVRYYLENDVVDADSQRR